MRIIQAAGPTATLVAAASIAAMGYAQPSNPPGQVVVNPSVLVPPSAAVLSAAYPSAALAQHQDGTALLECDVTKEGALVSCTSPAEVPVGLGFGTAAVSLASVFKMEPKTINGQPVDGGHIVITIRFVEPPPKPAAVEAVANHPWWTCPDPSVPGQSYYPKRARDLGKTGTAEIQCRIAATGKPETCVWIAESQPNLGFGDAAEKMACVFKMKPATTDGVPTASLFRTTIKFNLSK